MSEIHNILTTMIYHLTAPVTYPFPGDVDWKIDFTRSNKEEVLRLFKPCFSWVFDADNLQVYRTHEMLSVGPKGATITARKLETPECYYLKTGESCYACDDQTGCPPDTRGYSHVSGMLTTEGLFHPDLYRPGRIQVRCTLPQGGVLPATWLLHLTETQMFELDFAETGPTKYLKKPCVFGSIHEGESYARKRVFSSTRIYAYFEDDEMHDLDVIWDGKGLFYWYLDGFRFKRFIMSLPTGLNPYLALTLIVTQGLSSPRIWTIEHIKYKKG